MSVQQKIWDYIKNTDVVTKQEIITNLNIDKKSVTTYISALYKCNYLIFCATTKRADIKQSFKLINNTGIKAPLLNNGILKDFNIKKEIEIGKKLKINKNFNSQINLKDILDSFIELNKEEVLLSEVSKIFISKKDLTTKFGNSFLKRWIEKLELNKTITLTNNTYRNSKIYLVNLEKIKDIRKNLDNFEDYKLVL